MFLRMAICILLTLSFTSVAFAETYVGKKYNDRLFVPLRGVFQELGCEVGWEGKSQTVSISGPAQKIVLRVGSQDVEISGERKKTELAPRLEDGSVYVPLRFCAEALGAQVGWDEAAGQASIQHNNKQIIVRLAANGGALKQYSSRVNNITANVVEIPLGAAKAKVVLANNKIGSTEDLASMASRSGAVAAINGSFFEAYNGRPDPWNPLIVNGKVVHAGDVGSTIGFTESGTAKIASVRMKVEGGVNDSYQWPNNWYAYGFNHTPSSSGAYIFTPERGSTIGFSKGISIIVSGGKVTRIATGEDAAIPSNGYVLNFCGSEEYLATKFNVGDKVSYHVNFTNTGNDNWNDVVQAVGAGPRLVVNGTVSVNPEGEGYTEAKITKNGGARSAIGVKRDGTILLVTVPGATVYQLAGVMHKLGAYNAMNLDGGASSGLWLKGKYITKPGRLLSNALIFY